MSIASERRRLLRQATNIEAAAHQVEQDSLELSRRSDDMRRQGARWREEAAQLKQSEKPHDQ